MRPGLTCHIMLIGCGLVLLALSGGNAMACSCAPAASGRPAPILIQGRVTSVTSSALGVVARVRVLKTLRGRVPKMVTVETTAGSETCGVPLIQGEVKRIALAPLRDVYSTTACMKLTGR